MGYTLRPNSWHARFFSWIFDKDVRQYKTMCPYFWQWVILFFCLPVFVFFKLMTSGIIYLLEKYDDYRERKEFKNGFKKEKAPDERPLSDLERAMLILGACLFIGPLSSGFINWTPFFEFMGIMLVVILISAILLIICAAIGFVFKKVPFLAMLVDMVNATYHRWCPLLTWDDKKL